jgi:hypothetical protein
MIVKEARAMSIGSYHDILQRAREELSDAERLRLAEELIKPATIVTGGDGISRTLFDALSDRGLIGFMQDGPIDLSTNPKHMEGFGQHAD